MNSKMTFGLLLSLLVVSNVLVAASDPLYPKQWGLENKGQAINRDVSDTDSVSSKGIPGVDINWVETKDMPSTKKELIVAVIDSGVDIDHPDLKNRIWFNEKMCGNSPPNMKNLPCRGFNFLDNNPNVGDDEGHGTHVAGIIAASRNNIGVAGAADPRIKIMPLKVLNKEVNSFVYNGKVITDVIADAMIFAIKNGAEVINLSLGWPKLIDLEKVKKAFDLAEENNVVVIAAAGNNSKDLPTFPCSYENVICVGGVDNRGDLTDFSNHGAKVDLVGPSEWIISTYPQMLESRVLRIKNYEIKNGSSQGAPFVAAAVANLKLLNPGLTNDQVRNLLFRSSKKLHGQKLNKFVKFGMLDMKSLLALGKEKEEKAFVVPQLKSLTEIKYSMADRKFSLNIKFKNLSIIDYKGTACLNFLSEGISLEQNCFELEIGASKNRTLTINGSFSDLSIDSHALLQVKIDDAIFQTSLVFSRDINNDPKLEVSPIQIANFDEMAILRPGRRISKMMRVFDKHRQLDFPEYYFLDSKKQTDEKTNISLLTRSLGNYGIKDISMPKINNVISIHRQDINLDGKLDYFIYALSKKKDEILFHLFDEDLKPLFGQKSVWVFKLSTFEGLPIDGGVEKFEWIKIKHPTLGNILVPSLYRTYSMPEEDNSKIIKERIVTSIPHQFYLNPVEKEGKMNIELRVVDSVAMLKALNKELGIRGSFDTKTLFILRPFPQTQNESRNGIIKSLAIVEESGQRDLYEVQMNLGEEKHYSHLRSLNSSENVGESLIYPIIDSTKGMINDEATFTALLDRSTAEFLVKSDNSIRSILSLKESWSNPIISLMAVFASEKNEKSYFVESRSNLIVLHENGEKFILPIYRDSSFPGQTFAETFVPVLSDMQPGLYVNSTLIYGELLYVMVDTKEKGLIRPLNLSVGTPEGCIPLPPETLKDRTTFNYTFLCVSPSKQVSLKFLPMSHL